MTVILVRVTLMMRMMQENSCYFVNADDGASQSESDLEDNEPPVKSVTSKAPVRKAAKKEYV